MKLFYDHLLIPIHGIYAHIEHLEIDAKNKQELIQIVDSAANHTVIDTILSHLHRDHHETFLEKIHHSPHDPKHLDWLKTHVADIDSKIITAVNELASQFRASILSKSKVGK